MSPLDRLRSTSRAVSASGADDFLASAGRGVLLFTGDPSQRPEAQDVAVIASELVRKVPGLSVGVVPLEEESLLRARFDVSAVPAVVFVKDGRAVSTLCRVQDWAVYQRAAEVLFGRAKEVVS